MEKLTIVPETDGGKFNETEGFEVRFNPNQISFDRSVSWCRAGVAGRNMAGTSFTYGEPINLSMDLFFDSYAEGKDVRTYTRSVMALSLVRGKLERPPRFKLRWGRYTFEDAEWVVTRVAQRFTLFHPNGLPARATLTCSFRQWRSKEEEDLEQPKTGSLQSKTHVVVRGESLSTIAAKEYGDPSAWRSIAIANGIDDPRQLEPGRSLTIPPRQPGGSFGS